MKNQHTTQQYQLFPLGQTVATPGALSALAKLGMTGIELLSRHHRGDLGPEGIATNHAALENDARLFSSYSVNDIKIWIMTEADRSVTTLLLPEEY